jgi:hypothetical protein
VIAGHNLPVRNLSVKEFKDGQTTPLPQMTGHETREKTNGRKRWQKNWGQKDDGRTKHPH